MKQVEWLFLFYKKGPAGNESVATAYINAPSLLEASVEAWKGFVQEHPEAWRQMQACEQIIYVRIWM